jgi:hypothetical protein
MSVRKYESTSVGRAPKAYSTCTVVLSYLTRFIHSIFEDTYGNRYGSTRTFESTSVLPSGTNEGTNEGTFVLPSGMHGSAFYGADDRGFCLKGRRWLPRQSALPLHQPPLARMHIHVDTHIDGRVHPRYPCTAAPSPC